MSLVNNMLRDLEQQLDSNGLSALTDVKPAPPVRQRTAAVLPWLSQGFLLLLASAALVFCALMTLNNFYTPTQQVISTQLVLAPAVATRLIKDQPANQPDSKSQQKVQSKRSNKTTSSTKQSVVKKQVTIKQKQPLINIKRSGSFAKLNYQKAKKLLANKQIDAAIQLLASTLETNPNHLNTLDLYGELLLSARQYDQAIVVADKGFQTKPNYLPFVFIKAQALIQKGQLNDARQLLESKQQYAKKNIAYLNLQASVYRQMKEFKLALATYKSAIKISPDVSSLWIGLAISLDAMGETAAAQRAYRYVTEMPSANPALYRFALERTQVAKF